MSSDLVGETNPNNFLALIKKTNNTCFLSPPANVEIHDKPQEEQKDDFFQKNNSHLMKESKFIKSSKKTKKTIFDYYNIIDQLRKSVKKKRTNLEKNSNRNFDASQSNIPEENENSIDISSKNQTLHAIKEESPTIEQMKSIQNQKKIANPKYIRFMKIHGKPINSVKKIIKLPDYLQKSKNSLEDNTDSKEKNLGEDQTKSIKFKIQMK